MNYKKDITVLVPSWKNPHLLRIFIPNILSSFTLNNELIVCLNEADKESIDICYEYGIEFVVGRENYGTQAIDNAINLIKGKYVLNSNDDMLFDKGWDVDLVNLIEKNHPCSASCFLIEPRDTGNPVVFMDNLGEFVNVGDKFENNCKEGKYKGVMQSKVGYSHPILVRTEDYLSVGGYGNHNDYNWHPGWALDDFFPWMLWKKYNENFKFIISDKSYVYHGISTTNNKLPPDLKNKPNGDYFIKKTGITIGQFNQQIKRNWPTDNVYGSIR